jgi:multiple sugar transport system ATP-binding protein
MGSELYAYFPIESEGVRSQELDELAADSGAAEVPGSGANQIVARLDAASQVERGQEAEIWVDTTTLLFFDPQSGERLGADRG